MHTVGGVVEATKPIMVVVPSAGALVAEIKVLNRDVGFIRAGQAVAIKLEAFPFTRYGTLPGKIQSLGSDAVQDDKLGLVYSARVLVDQADTQRAASLKPAVGMQVTADIRTGRRSILSYLLSPIDEVVQEALREQ